MVSPSIVVKPPGPKSQAIFEKETKHMSSACSAASRFLGVVFEEGKGVTLRDVDGNTFLDFESGIVIMNTGHSHPRVTEAIKAQLDKLVNVYDYATPQRYELLEKLSEITPQQALSVSHMFTTGAEAVEGAIKLAKAHTGKHEFIAFHQAFHGKTAGAVSLTCLPKMSRLGFGPMLPGIIHVPYAYCYRCAFKQEYPNCGLYCVEYMREATELQSTGSLAAVFAEPIQGAGGPVVPPVEFLQELKKFCEEKNALYIDDEILAGFGRSGKIWAIEHSDVVPDVMTIGKGLASGIPTSVVVARKEIMQSETWAQPNVASSTFGGNPVAVAACLASIDVLLKEKLCENAEKVGAYLLERLQEMKTRHRLIGDVRGRGLLIGVELVKDQRTKEPATEESRTFFKRSFEKGVLVGTAGPWSNIVRIAPPLIVTKETVDVGLEILDKALAEVEHEI